MLFADDAKRLSIHRRNSHCELQGDLNVLNSWAANNSLQFNLDKCHILPFRPTDSSFVLNSATLENVSNEKDLSVIVSSDLSWTYHIRKQCRKVFFLIRRNISSSVSVDARLNLYKSMIVHVLTYNSPVWFANMSNQKSLESVQRRVTQWILSYQTESYFERMKTLNILPITLRLQICDLLTFSKIVSNHYDFDWFAHVNSNDSQHPLWGKCSPKCAASETREVASKLLSSNNPHD